MQFLKKQTNKERLADHPPAYMNEITGADKLIKWGQAEDVLRQTKNFLI